MTSAKIAAALVISGMLTAPAPALATAVIWNLSNVTFDDGAKATGYFTFDADTDAVSDYSISTSAGALAAYTYSNATAQPNPASDTQFLFVPYGANRYLILRTAVALTDLGGSVSLLSGYDYQSFECGNCFPIRAVMSGALVSGVLPSVPEPASWGLMVGGFGMLGAALRRRRVAVRFG